MMSLLMIAGVDVVTVKNDIGLQNNHLQVLHSGVVVLAIATTYAIWRIWDVGSFAVKQMTGLKAVWLGIFVLLWCWRVGLSGDGD